MSTIKISNQDSPNLGNTFDTATLEERAKLEYERLKTVEISTTVLYWELGDALRALRQHKGIRHGQWRRYVTSLGIDYTRACRALRIRRHYSSPEDCSELSIFEALDYCRRESVVPIPATYDEEGDDREPDSPAEGEKRRPGFSVTPGTETEPEEAPEVPDEEPEEEIEEEEPKEVTDEEFAACEQYIKTIGSLSRATHVFDMFLIEHEEVSDD